MFYEIGSVLSSVLPSLSLFRCFLGIASLIFSKFWHGARNHMKLCVTESDFPEKIFVPQKLGKWAKSGPKTWFFEFIETFCD